MGKHLARYSREGLGVDINSVAVQNSEHNRDRLGLSNVSFHRSDVFDNVVGQFDVIVCNHPFFDSDPIEGEMITRAWFNNGEFIERFFQEAPKYLKKGGKIIMPFFPFAGNKNNPKLHAERLGYKVETINDEVIDDENIQKGEFIIYMICL